MALSAWLCAVLIGRLAAAVNQYGAWLRHFRCMPTGGVCHLPASACSLRCRYYGMKQQLLESFGFGPDERFPVYPDRFPIQLLSYLRLSRIQDPGLFAKVGRAAQGSKTGAGRLLTACVTGMLACLVAFSAVTSSSTVCLSRVLKQAMHLAPAAACVPCCFCCFQEL